MALHGRTILELLRDNKVVHRIVEDNTITAYAQNVMNKGNFHYLAGSDKFMPLAEKLFGGVILTDIGNSTNGLPVSMIDHSANIIAQASNDGYIGTNLKRGLLDTTRTGPINGGKGYQLCWFWDQSRGNGNISSVCLCPPELSQIETKASAAALSAESSYCNWFLANNVRVSKELAQLTIIDYEKAVGYKVYLAASVIKVDEYLLNTKAYHLNGSRLDVIRDGNGDAYVTTYTITPSADFLSLYDASRATVCYTGDAIYFYTFNYAQVGGIWTTSLEECEISTSDFSSVEHSYELQGTKFYDFDYPVKDGFMLRKTLSEKTLYAYSDNMAKIVKCNLLNSTVVSEVANPLASLADETYNGPSLLLPNGDFYKFYCPSWNAADVNQPVLWYHNDTFYATQMLYKELYGTQIMKANGNLYGTALLAGNSGDTVDYQRLHLQSLSGYVSTVNDIPTVVKTGSLTMRVTYQLTES